jgi:TolB protein
VAGGSHELVVMDADGGGERTLVRPQGAAQPRGFAQHLAWSPDGTRVAYDDLGPSLAIADVATGAVVRIDEASSASWSPDGRLAYTAGEGAEHALFVANGDGSEPRRLLTRPGYALAPPQWSPSGRWMVYGDSRDLYRIAPDGTGGRRLTRNRDDERYPSWSPDGRRIAFFNTSEDGRRTALRVIDPTGRRLASVNVAPPSLYGGRPSWTPDGSRLAFLTIRGLRVVRLAGARVTGLVTPPAARGLTSPAEWARDGRRLLFSGHMTYTDREFYAVRPDGSGLRQLTHNAVDDRDPAWSPDGRRIVFVRPGGIHVAGADGRSVRRLTDRRGDGGPVWSPDGRRIAFTRGGRVWLMGADGRRERALAAATTLGSALSWSPDGTRVVTSDRGSVYAVDVASGRRTQLTRSDLDLAPAWSPDGRRIVFSGYRDERYFRDPEAWGLFELAPDGSGFRKLVTGYFHNVAWSPDGAQLVFQSYGMLWRANADGTGVTRIIGDGTGRAEGWNERPSWGP